MGARTTAQLAAAVDDLEAPGFAGRKERVDVDLVGPADEVTLGLRVRRAVHGAAAGIDGGRQIIAALERRLPLLDR